MTVSSQGSFGSSSSRVVRAWFELLSSMRFAIALLTVICIASVIGTVLKQQEPLVNYVNQFGPFWATIFGKLGLYAVYSAWWFLMILGFLVLSTSLCIIRNTPKILTDLRAYKENIREQALQAFHHRAQGPGAEAPEAAARRLGAMLASGGWKVKLQQRDTSDGPGWMVAAKAGAANKLGYLAAHSAIVLICLGGLLDGDLIVRAQMWLGGKTPYAGGGLIADVKPEHRLDVRNPTFRGNVLVAEGTQSNTVILNQSDGILLQELPFSIELQKFIVEYYDTGMPKLFASEIVIHDRATGATMPARVEVNHPARYQGVEIYQSSFDDGGSTVRLRGQAIHGAGKPFDVEGTIGSSTRLSRGNEELTLEYTGLRVINVENFAGKGGAEGATDVRKVDLHTALDQRLGAANKTENKKTLRNVGPSVSYKLRDAAGQAREFNNYMLPMDLGDGVPVYLFGMRDRPDEAYRYLRIPADSQGSTAEFYRLRAALSDANLRTQAVRRYAARIVDPKRKDLLPQLETSALRAMSLFAGVESVRNSSAPGGLQTVADFMESNVPEAERGRAGDMLVRILNGSLFELLQLTRERAGLKPLATDEATQGYMSQMVLAQSDAYFYPVPVVLQLADFKHLQASVFQVARAPGKNVVYLGCALLIVGIFAMLYVRERRLWIWVSPQGAESHITMALSSNRQTMDVDREFEQLRDKLLPRKEP